MMLISTIFMLVEAVYFVACVDTRQSSRSLRSYPKASHQLINRTAVCAVVLLVSLHVLWTACRQTLTVNTLWLRLLVSFMAVLPTVRLAIP